MLEAIIDRLAEFLVLALLFALSGACSGSETAFTSISQHRRQALISRGGPTARLLADLPGTIATILLWNNLVNLTVASLVTLLLGEALGVFGGGQQWVVVGTVLVATPLLLVFGEITPKALARRHPETFVAVTARVWWVARLMAAPVVSPMRRIGRVEEVLERREPEAVLVMSELAAEEGSIGDEEQARIASVLAARDLAVSKVMHPWSVADVLPAGLTARQAESWMAGRRRSRMPLAAGQGRSGSGGGGREASDGSQVSIAGVVHIKDLAMGQRTPEAVVRPPLWVEGGRSMLALMRMMQERRVHFAFVRDEADESGDDPDEPAIPAGFVTLTDVLERLIGELPDDDASGVRELAEAEDDGELEVAVALGIGAAEADDPAWVAEHVHVLETGGVLDEAERARGEVDDEPWWDGLDEGSEASEGDADRDGLDEIEETEQTQATAEVAPADADERT